MKPLFVILVTYRRLAEFRRTVESLLPTLPEGSVLLIVDNNSPDEGYYEYLQHVAITAPGAVRVEVFIRPTNDGWGAAMNEGLTVYKEWRDYEFVLESNNDVEYDANWFERALNMMTAHPQIGILGGFKHPYHGTRKVLSDGLVIKDDMPACAWFMRSRDLAEFLPFPEHGPCKTRGGNGEDVGFRDKVQNKLGRWVCGMEPDWAKHIDGYDIPDLGKPNPAYD